MSRYLRTYSGARAISNKSNESNEYERTRIKVRSFVANGYSLRIVSCSEDSFDSRPCSLIIYSNGLKFGRFVRCPSLAFFLFISSISYLFEMTHYTPDEVKDCHLLFRCIFYSRKDREAESLEVQVMETSVRVLREDHTGTQRTHVPRRQTNDVRIRYHK